MRLPFRLLAVSQLMLLALAPWRLTAEPIEVVAPVELQPLRAHAQRAVDALELVGSPLSADTRAAFDKAMAISEAPEATRAIQQVLDPLCLAAVNINPESRVKVEPGEAAAELVEHGWTAFLVKVHNEAGVTARLRAQSPNALPLQKPSSGSPDPKPTISATDVVDRWMDLELYRKQPLGDRLSGLPVQYVIVEIYSRDAGEREAKLSFDVGQGTQDLGFRSDLNALFHCKRACELTIDVRDEHNEPTTAHFVFRDARGRVYPARSRRLAPDLYFHDQIYRASGETVGLPPGEYEVSYGRGPEYRQLSRKITVPDAAKHQESFRVERWIKLADLGWYSGDHHVHAAGCKHYESPAEGVKPEDMMKHILGEDLNVGCVLAWGPCWYFQKQYFEGKVHALSLPRYLMRYDVEVSGFPSSHAGHLCLLRLSEDDYPGTTRIEEWPSWDLPVLKWGKAQGGVVGFSHSGWGLQVPAQSLPTFDMPAFDGIGANEYIVDVVHDTCDFISSVDTPAIWELNIWYHTLNCGYTCRLSGETDFPCIYGERVGLGRVYVGLDKPPADPLDYDKWVYALRDGRSYVSDGLCHLYDFEVGGLAVGRPGEGGRTSVLATATSAPLKIKLKAAALLEEKPNESIRKKPLDAQPYWHVERARVESSRRVPVELIVNGEAVARKEIEADGHIEDITFDYTPSFSSWVAVRVFPSAHTNPVFVEVEGKPIRASKKSAQWCLDAVDVCWKRKAPQIRDPEKAAAAEAYEAAREAYRRIKAEAHEG